MGGLLRIARRMDRVAIEMTYLELRELNGYLKKYLALVPPDGISKRGRSVARIFLNYSSTALSKYQERQE